MVVMEEEEEEEVSQPAVLVVVVVALPSQEGGKANTVRTKTFRRSQRPTFFDFPSCNCMTFVPRSPSLSLTLSRFRFYFRAFFLEFAELFIAIHITYVFNDSSLFSLFYFITDDKTKFNK